MSLKDGMSPSSSLMFSLRQSQTKSNRIASLTVLTADSFPSSAAFDAINQTLQADAAERKNAVDSAKAVVAFNLKNSKGEEKSWYLDLKNKGEVGQGAAPAGGKADGEFWHFFYK